MASSFLSLDPELEFVIRASGPRSNVPDGGNVRDWNRVVALALHHRVYPRVWQAAASLFPEPWSAAMHRYAQSNACAALRNLAATIDTVELLRSVGVEPIVLKGPLLSHLLYGNYALRVAGDVDLLVPAKQIQLAAATLSKAGFAHHTALRADLLERHQKTEHDVAFARPADGILIELHGDIAQPLYGYRVDLEYWQRAAATHTASGTRLSTLSPEHGYVLCALHAAKHRWHRFDLIGDLAAYATLGQSAANLAGTPTETWMRALIRTGEELVAGFYGGGGLKSRVARDVAAKVVAGGEFGRWGGIWLDVRLRNRTTEQGRYLLNRLVPSMFRS